MLFTLGTVYVKLKIGRFVREMRLYYVRLANTYINRIVRTKTPDF